MERKYDVIAMGELLIDFTMNGQSGQGNNLFEACPGGAPCNDEVNTTLAFVHTFPDGDREFSFYRNPGADMMLRED